MTGLGRNANLISIFSGTLDPSQHWLNCKSSWTMLSRVSFH